MENQSETETPETATAKTPRHLQRAAKLRTKAGQFLQDTKLLGSWQKHDKTGTVDKILGELKNAQQALENAASLYETLPESVTKPRRGKASKITAGDTVQVKEKYMDTYLALSNGEPVDCLKVVQVRDTHAVVEMPDGERMFVAMKELEPATDSADEEAAAE